MVTLLKLLKPFSPLLIAMAAPNLFGLMILVFMFGYQRSNYNFRNSGKTGLRQLRTS